MQDLSAPFFFLEADLELGELKPGRWQVRKGLTVFLIDLSDPVDLAQLLLQLNIVFEALLFGTQTNGSAVDFPGLGKVVATQAEVCVELPEFGEGKLLVRHCLDGPLKDQLSLCTISGHLLLESCVVVPDVHISSPEALLFCRRLLLDRGLVDEPHCLYVFEALLQPN